MAKNLTLKLSDQTLIAMRRLAAEGQTSLSCWVSMLIEKEILKRKGFIKAKRHAIKQISGGIKLNPKKITRESLYE